MSSGLSQTVSSTLDRMLWKYNEKESCQVNRGRQVSLAKNSLWYLLLYSEDSQVQKTPVQKTIPGIGLEHLGILHSVYVQLVQFMHSTRVMMTTEACTGKMHTQQNKKGNILNHKWTICFITKL